MEICFATNNDHKLREIKSMLPTNFNILSLEDIGCREELAEDQNTLEGNSYQKAEYIFKKYNIACFADDTGLEVYALDGRPGVRSARYAGELRDNEANITRLLKELQNTENRKAQFRTVISLILPGKTKQFEGTVKGEITLERVGRKGFGYDPVFLPKGYDKTFAEMSMEEKNLISHRAIAVNKLVNYLSSGKIDKQ